MPNLTLAQLEQAYEAALQQIAAEAFLSIVLHPRSATQYQHVITETLRNIRPY